MSSGEGDGRSTVGRCVRTDRLEGEHEDHHRLLAIGDGAADGETRQPGEVPVEGYHVLGHVEPFRER
jgi:hypothetical protein